jgi:hypothetical protein
MDMMNKKIPAELRFNENTGEYSLHEGASEELCKDGKPHKFEGWQEFEDGRGGTTVCSVCGLTAFEHALRYGP